MADDKKKGRKFWLAVIWGIGMLVVLAMFLVFKIRSDVLLGAWLGAFVAIPIQFGVANAAITRKYLSLPPDE